MSYSPLNLNCISSFINNNGLAPNADSVKYIGYYTIDGYEPGELVKGTFLEKTAEIYRLAFDIRYPVVTMGHLVVGRRYFIRTLGTPGLRTDFTVVGSATSTVGVVFIATSTGGDIGGSNGTCNDVTGLDQTGMSLSQYTSLLTMGTSIPLLGNSIPSSYFYTMDLYTTECRFGFLGEFAVQAYKELYINNASYSDFFNTFSTIMGFKDSSNQVIDSLNLAVNYLDGIYSNMNDLITSDITGVSISTFFWGQDLINLGRALDLKTIDTFGNPDNLLRTLAANKAITGSLNIALTATGLSINDITNIMNGQRADSNQQKLLYACFNLISGSDLEEILLPLNCHTEKLNSLADLLDLKKIFPTSYQTLTFPQYNSEPKQTNSKTYYLLYQGEQVNKIPSLSYGDRLIGVLPSDIAYACDAFSASMRQIKNIQNIDVEKFAQVVTNLENVTDLDVNGTNTPTNKESVQNALSKIAYGTGTNGKYRTVDFFRSLTNLHYPWVQLKDLITQLSALPEIAALEAQYNTIYNLLNVPSGTFTDVIFSQNVQPVIDQINISFNAIVSTYPDLVMQVNYLYNTIGSELASERFVRKKAIPGGTEYTTSTTTDIYSFINDLTTYSTDTELGETSSVIENICDTTTLGGQSLIGSMRESRNSQRIGLMGGQLDNQVQDTPLDLPIPNGTKVTLPTTTGEVTVSVVNGATKTPGSLGGSPQSTLIPSNLNILNMSIKPTVLMPSDAIGHVSACNCDCWDLLQ